METYQYDVVPGSGVQDVTLPQNATTRSSAEWIKWGIISPTSDSGEVVTPRTAMRHSPIWQGINIIAGDTGQLHFEVTRRDGDRRVRDESHAVDWLITNDPNEHQTIDVWLETMQAWAIGWGNAISVIVPDRRGRPEQLLPLLPDRTRADTLPGGGYVILSRIDSTGEWTPFLPDQCVHVRGLTHDGFWGMSAVETCKNAIGHGMALLHHGNSVFRNGVRPSGVLKTAQSHRSFTPEARDNLRSEWEEIHAGSDNAGRIALLTDGMEWQQLSMSNEDAQWLEARELDILFSAGVLNLPPYKLGYMKDSAVRANLEAQQREYYNSSLSRHANRIRRELARKLFTLEERRNRGYQVKVDPDSLTEGTRAERVNTVAVAITHRLMTRNEGREALGMNPVDGGDVFENPAIDTNSSADQPSEGIENALRRRGVQPLLAAEDGKIRNAARRAKNFLRWLDEFAGGYLDFAGEFVFPFITMTVSNQAAARSALEIHVGSLRESLLQVTETVGPSELAAAVSEHLSQVRDHSEAQLLNSLLEAMKP